MSQSSDDSVTEWIDQLKTGDKEAAQRLWERYFTELARVAQRKLRASRRRVADEEDVALEAMYSLMRGAKQGRFPNLHDRHDLWLLLVTIVGRKADKQVRHERRLKRGGGTVRGESAFFDEAGSGSDAPGLAAVPQHASTPAFASQVVEECARLFGLLDDPQLRQIALWRLEGYTNKEIADKLGRVETTVERKLQVIRDKWGSAAAESR